MHVYTASAQTLPYSIYSSDKNLSFQKVITTNSGRMMVIFGREKWMKLCDYLWVGIHDKPDARSKEYRLIPDKARTSYYFKDALTTSSGVWFVFYNYIKSKHSIEIVLIPFDEEAGQLRYQQEIHLPFIDAQAILNGSFYLFQSPDKNQLGILNVSGILDDYKKKFYMCSVNMLQHKINYTMKDYLPADAHTYEVLKPMIDNTGAYYVLAKRYKTAGSELVSQASNYFYLIEHFENNLTRRSTGIYVDEKQIARYPDALILDDNVMAVSFLITDTSLIHPEKFELRHYQLSNHEFKTDTIITLNNIEPRINSSFVTDIFRYQNNIIITSSGQYLEEVAGARLSHSYDVIKTYSILASCTGNACNATILKTPLRMRESQAFIFPLLNELHMISFSQGSTDYVQWNRFNLSSHTVSNVYTISSNVWKKNLPYFFASCMQKPVVLQHINNRYQLIYLP